MAIFIDYDDINAELIAVGAGVRASECHGFLCGHFCASNTVATDLWEDYMLSGIEDAADLDDCIAILSQLANQVSEEILADEMSFSLLLPGDEFPISERSSALAKWCSGFISGLGIGGFGEKQQLVDECDEFVKDLVSMSRIETTVEDDEDAEAAMFEIIEYIRIGVIMLHQEWHYIGGNNERPEVLH